MSILHSCFVLMSNIVSQLISQAFAFVFGQEKLIKRKGDRSKSEHHNGSKGFLFFWVFTSCHISRRTKDRDRRMRQSATMCPHPRGAANDLTVLRGQYGISCLHPGAWHREHRGMHHGHMVAVFFSLAGSWLSYWFSQQRILQISCSFPFSKSKLPLAIMFHQLTRGRNISVADTSS